MRVWMLVVLVLLIFVVAAYLFPILVRDRGNGKAPAISNVKQLTLAIMYAQDYDEVLGKPPPARGAGPSSPGRSPESSGRAGANH